MANVDNYSEQGGDSWVVGGTLNVTGDLELSGTALAASAAEINRACDVSTRLVSLTAATATITAATHEGKTLLMSSAASPIAATYTLPAASGSGAIYTFKVGIVGSYVIKVVGNDVMYGHSWQTQDSADTVVAFETAATSDTITLNGTTKGGAAIGDVVVLQDIAADSWSVLIHSTATGTEATPFSAAVS